MGIADIIPGISGGTIALLLGIYEDFILSIKSFDLLFLKLILTFRFKEAFERASWKFLGSILLGIVLAIKCLSSVIKWLLNDHPVLINAFFFGLICATVPLILRIIKKWNFLITSLLIISTALAFFLVSLVPISTPETLWFVFFCGVIAISAMIMPGISGAFILLLLGKYQFIIEAIDQRDMVFLSAFILGIGVGVLTFVRILSWLFKHFHDATLACLSGIVIGSLAKIWPWKETLATITTSHGKVLPTHQINILPTINGDLFVALSLVVIGLSLGLLLNCNPKGPLLQG